MKRCFGEKNGRKHLLTLAGKASEETPALTPTATAGEGLSLWMCPTGRSELPPDDAWLAAVRTSLLTRWIPRGQGQCLVQPGHRVWRWAWDRYLTNTCQVEVLKRILIPAPGPQVIGKPVCLAHLH